MIIKYLSANFLKLIMNMLILFLGFVLILSPSIAQEIERDVLSTSGEFHKGSNGSLSWTMGEIAVQTVNSNNLLLTQGFQQNSLTVTAIDESDALKYTVKAFPNPVKNTLALKISEIKEKSIMIELYNITGNLLLKKEIKSTNTIIPFNEYQSGEYILRVIEENKPVKSFKIIKQ